MISKHPPYHIILKHRSYSNTYFGYNMVKYYSYYCSTDYWYAALFWIAKKSMLQTLSNLTTLGTLIPPLERIANTLFENLTQFEVRWPYYFSNGTRFVQYLLIKWVIFINLFHNITWYGALSHQGLVNTWHSTREKYQLLPHQLQLTCDRMIGSNMNTDTLSLSQPNTYIIYCHTTMLSINDLICIPMTHPFIHKKHSSNWSLKPIRGQVLCWMDERYTHMQYFPLSNKYQVNYDCQIGSMQLCKIQY